MAGKMLIVGHEMTKQDYRDCKTLLFYHAEHNEMKTILEHHFKDAKLNEHVADLLAREILVPLGRLDDIRKYPMRLYRENNLREIKCKLSDWG